MRRPDALEEFTSGLGKLVSNFQSLELGLRAFLYTRCVPPHTPLPRGLDMFDLEVGDQVPINSLTNYDSLGALIESYNREVSGARPDLTLDKSLVALRDAIAHGRVSAAKPEPPLRLLKFAKPAGGLARVTYSVVMTNDWLANQVARVHEQLMKVMAATAHFA